jgi:hypothetical protein
VSCPEFEFCTIPPFTFIYWVQYSNFSVSHIPLIIEANEAQYNVISRLRQHLYAKLSLYNVISRF